MLFLISLILFFIWVAVFFACGGFWRVWECDADRMQFPAPTRWPCVTAVIPARNEAASIAVVVAALIKQDYPGEFSMVIVDDHSDDTTADLARTAAESSVTSRLQILSAPPLAPGWTGKLWALNFGVSAVCSADFSVGESQPVCAAGEVPPGLQPLPSNSSAVDFFWFTDADVVHAPDTLRRLVSRA